MSNFNWLHLTDLHWGRKEQAHLWPEVRDRFFEDLVAISAKHGPFHAVLFSGDLVQAGKAEEFKEAEQQVLAPLWETFRRLDCNPAMLAVPGNHDLRRPEPTTRSAATDMLLQDGGFRTIGDKFWAMTDSEYRNVIDNAFASYSSWWNERRHAATQHIQIGVLPGDFSTVFETTDGRRVGVVGLNTTFLQLGAGEYRGRLACDPRQFHAACKSDGPAWARECDVCLLLTHQGPEWLDTECRARAYAEINPAGRFAVHIFGHMHEEKLIGRSHMAGPIQRLWQGRSLFGLEHYGDPTRETRSHGYSVGSLSFHKKHAVLRRWPRKAVCDEVNGWRFVPDIEGCVLSSDGGTKAEKVQVPFTPARSTRPNRCGSTSRNVDRPLDDERRPGMAPGVGAEEPFNLRLHFEHLIEAHTLLFAGRDEEKQLIVNHVQDVRTGYVFLEGLSGYGKTSLLAKLVQEHPTFAYHFISQAYKGLGNEFDPTQQDSLIQNICEQLTGRAELTSHCQPRLRFQALLRNSSSEKPVVIVIDAIDEVGKHPNFLHGLLPRTLPDGVTVIISARTQGDRNYLSEVGLELNSVRLHLALHGFSPGEIRLLLNLAGGHAQNLSNNARFVEKLHAVSSGDPFYLRFLVEDIAASLIGEDNINTVPTGLSAYLDKQLDQLNNSAQMAQQRDIIGLILEANDPLSRFELIDMVPGLDRMNFASIVRDIHRFLIVTGEKYTMCHDRFKEYFASKV